MYVVLALVFLGAVKATDDGCSCALELCGGQGWQGPTCCVSGTSCLTPRSGSLPGGYGDPDVDMGGYGFYGADESTQPYSICAPDDADTATGAAGLDLPTLTLADTLASLSNGTLTSAELTSAALAQIARYESTYNAFTFLNPDALAQARASDARRASGAPLGALEGVPTVIKEPLDVVGFPSTLGWNFTYSGAGGVDLLPKQNAVLVDRLLQAGIVNLGKTNIPPFSAANTRLTTRTGVTSWDGLTFNFINPQLVPGASSSGTATAVASGMAIWGIGEETGGSIQNPSAAQSLVGIKTTQELVSTDGVAPRSSGNTRDVLGPIAKTVRDAAIALNAMTGYGTPAYPPQAPAGGYESLLDAQALQGTRLGLFGSGFREAAELAPEIQEAYENALAELRSLGATTVDDPFAGTNFAALRDPKTGYNPQGVEAFPYAFSQYLQRGFGIESYADFVQLVGADPLAPGAVLGAELETFPEGPEKPVLEAALEDPSQPPNLQPFRDYRAQLLAIFDGVFKGNGLDALVFPQATTQLPAALGEDNIDATTVGEINILGVPAVIVPSTRLRTPSGAPSPFALIFIGPANSEAALLALAFAYEQATMLRWVPELTTSIEVADMWA